MVACRAFVSTGPRLRISSFQSWLFFSCSGERACSPAVSSSRQLGWSFECHSFLLLNILFVHHHWKNRRTIHQLSSWGIDAARISARPRIDCDYDSRVPHLVQPRSPALSRVRHLILLLSSGHRHTRQTCEPLPVASLQHLHIFDQYVVSIFHTLWKKQSCTCEPGLTS